MTTSSSSSGTGHRLTVTFAESTYKTLLDLESRRGVSKGEVLRDAISLAKYLQELQDAGGKILVERKGESPREIFLK